MGTLRLLLTACLVLMAAPCSAQAPEAPITIGAEDDWYPYGGVVDGEVRGLGIDLVRAAFAERGIQVKFVALPYKRCLEMTRQSELLACTQPARNPETEADFLWPDQPLLHAVSRIYARAPGGTHPLSMHDLEGKVVIVTNGFEYGAEFDGNPNIKRLTATKEMSVFRMLLAQRADFAVAYEKTAEHLFNQHPQSFKGRFEAVGLIAKVPQYLVFARRHAASERMLAAFNQGFRQIQSSGELQRIERKWRGSDALP